MEDNHEKDNYDDYDESSHSDKSLKGYKFVILLLIVVLAAVSALYFMQTHQMRSEYSVERDTLTNQLELIRNDFANLKTSNDTISQNLNVERSRADSLMDKLQHERNLSRATIRRYQSQINMLRGVMKNYIHQIDSLNSLNQKLISQNVTYRKEIATQAQRADMAEEKAGEMEVKIRQGSVVKARDIQLVTLNSRDKVVTRASRADRLRVDFTLTANDLTQPGSRIIYVRITAPDGYIMATPNSKTFQYEGDAIAYTAMREVDYQNQDLPVSIYYNGSGISAGTYQVDVYMDGYVIGSLKQILR